MFRLIKYLSLIVACFVFFFFLYLQAHQDALYFRRDLNVLMDRYYLLQKSNPLAARSALKIILKQNPDYEPALKELSQLYLGAHHVEKALPLLERLHQLKSTHAPLTYQLGQLYYDQGQWDKASLLFTQLTQSSSLVFNQKAQQMLQKMASILPQYQQESVYEYQQSTPLISNAPTIVQAPKQILQPSTTQEYRLMTNFYSLKASNKKEAWILIQHIINHYPNQVVALKEGAYLALELSHPKQAIAYFERAYAQTQAPSLALQLGYLYAMETASTPITPYSYRAYHYFNQATKTTDKPLQLKAEQALTNLAGYQTKALPPPYFSEFFFSPFSQSRFDLTVIPMLARAGIEQTGSWRAKEYVVFRRTQDNKSINAGQVPQIYEDNVQIIGLGGQVSPVSTIPFAAYAEIGKAYDLIPQNRNRWRDDVRGGFIYFNEWGNLPAYYNNLTGCCSYYGALYSDVTYFSRYHNNIIGTMKTHQGLHLLQYQSSLVNLYLSGRIIEDTNRDFFNNIAEIGPGIGFIPSNRYHLELRFEHINGVYLPVGNQKNPYSKYYINNTVQLLFYIKL